MITAWLRGMQPCGFLCPPPACSVWLDLGAGSNFNRFELFGCDRNQFD
jgi:hypothetical protein